MQLSKKQINSYNTFGYVVIKAPYLESLLRNALNTVEARLQPIGKKIIDTKGNHFRLQPQVTDSYWCALDHSLPFLQMELHHQVIELAKQIEGDTDIYFRNGGINELAPGRSFLWHRDSGDEYVEFMHYLSGSNKKRSDKIEYAKNQNKNSVIIAKSALAPPNSIVVSPVPLISIGVSTVTQSPPLSLQ